MDNIVEKMLKVSVSEQRDEKVFLNSIAKGISNIGIGYWFTGESVDEDGNMVFEFSSSKAPTILVLINKDEFDRFISGEHK